MRLALVFTLFFYLLANSTAQTSEPVEEPKVKFGINIGLNYSNVIADEQLPTSATLSNGFGFRLEVLAEYPLFDRIYVSPKAGFSFNDSRLTFLDSKTGTSTSYQILPLCFEGGLHFQIKKSSPNSRPYIYAGPSVKVPIQESSEGEILGRALWTPSVDFGMGYDKDFGYFTFAPEFRYSIGYRNVIDLPEIGNTIFHNFSLIFNFLG